MRISLVTVFLVICVGTTARSQFDDVYGKLVPGDVDMRECTFDPGADAVVLISEGTAEYNQFQNEVGYRHTRIKILKEKGLKYADFKIRYFSKYNSVIVDDIQAMTINIVEGGHRKEFPVDNKNIYKRKINNRISEISFAFPEVRVGSILEYKYRTTIQGAGLNDWNFQGPLPVCFSSYKLKAPKYVEVSYAVQKHPQYNIVVAPEKSSNSIYFEMRNVPSLADEPFMESQDSYLQKVKFKISGFIGNNLKVVSLANWEEFGKWLNDKKEFGQQLKIGIAEGYSELQNVLANKTEFEKLRSIHSYVREKIKWNGADGIFSYTDVDQVFQNRKGSSASINLLFINLLLNAGFEAFPVLVSEHGNGRINTSSPYVDDFSTVVAKVKAGGKYYYLDATDRFNPAHLIPLKLLNTSAYVADRNKGAVIFINDEQLKSRNNIAIDARLDISGRLEGVTEIISTNYSKIKRKEDYHENRETFVEKNILKGATGITVDSFKIINLDNDSLPLSQQFIFNTALQETGNYYFLNLNRFTGYEINPFLSESRLSDIDFNYVRGTTLNYVISLPENFLIDALPKSIELVNEDKTISFSRQVNYLAGSRQIVARIKIEINKSLFSADEYPVIKDFFRKMIELLEEPVVLKKNNS